MQAAANDRIVILVSLTGIFLIGVACLFWPRQLQRVATRWADLGMYPFPNFVRSGAYVMALRVVGVLSLAITCYLLSGVAADLLRSL